MSIEKIERNVEELKEIVAHIDEALRGSITDTSKKSLLQRVSDLETQMKIIASITFPLLVGLILTGVKLWLT